MKATSDRRPMLKRVKQQIRKADRKAKHSSFKQKERDVRVVSTSFGSPASKALSSNNVSRIIRNGGDGDGASIEYARKLFHQIQQLIEGGALQSEHLYEAVDVLKYLVSHANEEENSPASTHFYQSITTNDCSMLARLLVSPDVCERTQIKTAGFFLELAYSPFSHLILQSPQVLDKMIRTLFVKNKALRVRAVGCMANLVEDATVRDSLLSIPEVNTGL